MRRPDAELRRDRPRRLVDSPKPGGRDEGIAFVTVAISLLVLLGMAALAIDGSNLYRERGDAQNAADLAAYAAAYDACTGGSSPIEAGREQATANGFDNSDPKVTVDITEVQIDPKEELNGWQAEVSTEADRFFSKILGTDKLGVNATAVALCTQSEEALPALFAAGSCDDGKPALDWSGSSTRIEGAIHTNDDISVSGSSNKVEGAVTYVSGKRIGGSGNNFAQGPDSAAWRKWPKRPDRSDFSEYGPAYRANSSNFYFKIGVWDLTKEQVKKGGIYIATEGIKISDSDVSGKVTLITLPTEEDKGFIDISGSNVKLEPYYNGILAYADYYKGGKDYPDNPGPYSNPPECGNPAIKIAGGKNQWKGLIYAPRGTVEMSGSDTSTLWGSIYGWNIKLNGSDLRIVTGMQSTGDLRMTLVR